MFKELGAVRCAYGGGKGCEGLLNTNTKFLIVSGISLCGGILTLLIFTHQIFIKKLTRWFSEFPLRTISTVVAIMIAISGVWYYHLTYEEVREATYEKRINWDIEMEYTLDINQFGRGERAGSDVTFIRPKEGEEQMQIQVFSTIQTLFPEYKPLPVNYRPLTAKPAGIVTIGGKSAQKYFTETPELTDLYYLPYTAYVILLEDHEWMKIEYYGDGKIQKQFESIISTIKFNTK